MILAGIIGGLVAGIYSLVVSDKNPNLGTVELLEMNAPGLALGLVLILYTMLQVAKCCVSPGPASDTVPVVVRGCSLDKIEAPRSEALLGFRTSFQYGGASEVPTLLDDGAEINAGDFASLLKQYAKDYQWFDIPTKDQRTILAWLSEQLDSLIATIPAEEAPDLSGNAEALPVDAAPEVGVGDAAGPPPAPASSGFPMPADITGPHGLGPALPPPAPNPGDTAALLGGDSVAVHVAAPASAARTGGSVAAGSAGTSSAEFFVTSEAAGDALRRKGGQDKKDSTSPGCAGLECMGMCCMAIVACCLSG